nr:MAK10-like protein [Tanacetum cinerariifolium]
MTNKIDIVLKAITDQIMGALSSDTVKNPKLNVNSITSALYARSHPMEDPQSSSQIHSLINVIIICPKQPNKPQNDKSEGEDQEERSNSKNIDTAPPHLIIHRFHLSHKWKNVDSREEGPEDKGSVMIEGLELEFFDTFPIRSELAYHRKLDPREDTNRGVRNFTGRIKGMHVFVGNFTYVIDFMIVEDISSIIDPRVSQVVLGKSFVEISNMTHDPLEGVVRFINGTDEIADKMPHKIE